MEAPPQRRGGRPPVQLGGEDVEELGIGAVVGEVGEGEVHGTGEGAGSAELLELVTLAVAAGHAPTMGGAADLGLSSR